MASLHARAIVSLKDLQAFLGQTADEDLPESDDNLIEIINAISLNMEQRLGRTFINANPRIEILAGTGRPYVRLINSPAASVTTIEEYLQDNTWRVKSSQWTVNSEYQDDPTLFATSTKLYSPDGEIFAKGSRNYRVTYVPAWTTRGTLPPDLRHNAMKLMALRDKQKQRKLTGVTSVTVDEEQQTINFNWPREVVDALSVYDNNII